jgi:flagella basal body P-ring formation protein FlgA
MRMARLVVMLLGLVFLIGLNWYEALKIAASKPSIMIVTTRDLAMGEKVEPGDLAFAIRRTVPLPDAVIRQADAIGACAKQGLKAGTPIRWEDLIRPEFPATRCPRKSSIWAPFFWR